MTILLNTRVRVVPKNGRPVFGTLLELDEQNIVVETQPGHEEVFRMSNVAQVEPDGAPRRVITQNQPTRRIIIR